MVFGSSKNFLYDIFGVLNPILLDGSNLPNPFNDEISLFIPYIDANCPESGIISAMSSDQYLRNILAREQIDTGLFSPVRNVAMTLSPMLNRWGNGYLLRIDPSGSFAKSTGNRSGTDIDLFLSLSSDTPNTLAEIRTALGNCLNQNGYQYRDQNVSLGITVAGYQVDLVPGKRQSQYGGDHSLYRKKADTWTKTNIQTHINLVRGCGRIEEIRVLKLWRDQNGIDFPSIYLELATLEALRGKPLGRLSENVADALRFFEGNFASKRVVDPANTNNIISDDLTAAGKQRVATAAKQALAGNWTGFIV